MTVTAASVTLSKTSMGGVGECDLHSFLIHDIAGVRLFHHVVKGGAGLGLAVDYRPVDRHPAAVSRAGTSRGG